MVAFFDNDVLLKLAALDLLDPALACLGVTHANVRVLPTFKYRLSKVDESSRTRLLAFLARVAEWQEPMNAEDEDSMLDVLGIDEGELAFASAASRIPDAWLISGDKNFIVALGKDARCREVAERLQGRVVCFEHVLSRLIASLGFERIREVVVPMRSIDGTLRSAFGSGEATTQVNALDALRAFAPRPLVPLLIPWE